MNKKAVWPIVLTLPIIIVLAVVFILILGWTVFLTMNLLTLVGAAMLVISVIALTRGVKAPVYVWVMGIVLLLIPYVFKAAKSLTIANVFG